MNLTKKEIIEKMRDEMPYSLEPKFEPYITEAMQRYADQETKLYASYQLQIIRDMLLKMEF